MFVHQLLRLTKITTITMTTTEPADNAIIINEVIGLSGASVPVPVPVVVLVVVLVVVVLVVVVVEVVVVVVEVVVVVVVTEISV